MPAKEIIDALLNAFKNYSVVVAGSFFIVEVFFIDELKKALPKLLSRLKKKLREAGYLSSYRR